MNILLPIVYFFAIFLVLTTLFRATYFKTKKDSIKPYGQLVEVGDGTMHVYSMGHSEKKIVLLAGLGVPLPSASFSPLMRALSQKYTVICVEYFGVGFSSETSAPRTSENYVREIRTALDQAGYPPPYVLMPHSISSVYSEHYAAQYPEEVEGIICLDGSSTAFYDPVPKIIKHLLKIVSVVQVLGIIPIIGYLTTNKEKLRTLGFTPKEGHDVIIFSGFSMNKTVIEQMVESSEHVKQVMDVPFPESVPYLKIISKETWETPIKQLKMTPQDYQYQHLARIGAHAKHEILEGDHFLFTNNAEGIAALTDRFLSNSQEPITSPSRFAAGVFDG